MTAPSSDLAALNRSRQPLYLQLAAEFRRLVDAGDWPVEAQIPTLDILMDRYQVSRVTVRQALGQLEGEGIVSRSRGKGSFVRARPTSAHELRLPTTWNEVVALSDVLGTHAIVTAESWADRLPDNDLDAVAPQADRYRFLCRLHSKDGIPYCYSEVHVAADLFLAHEALFNAHAAASVIARIAGLVLAESRQALTIVQAGLRSAHALQIEVGEPVAEVRRHAGTAEQLIYFSRLEFPTRFVKLELDLLAHNPPL